MFEDLKQKASELWSKRPGFLRGRSLWLTVGGLVVVLIAWNLFGGGDDEDPYRTAAVDRGAITRVVSATGTLQPLVSANVGSTVSGPVQSVSVDFNSQVRAGQELARLDPTPFQQRIVQAQAQLAQAQAQAAVANSDYQRYVLLQQRGFASEQLMSQQRAARDTARAAVSQAAAQVAAARTDLERSVIRSPIDGVVVDRQVNVGQPVASSLQAATLFVIAQDLSRLQANITVDEADIGDVREGQSVRFTVDAFPDREFDGVVSQLRQQGVAESGVVSYTVVVQADNPGRQLLPGMTANAEIVLEQRENVLRLPNTALRFRPADDDLVAQGQALMSGGRGQRGGNAGEAVAQERGEAAGRAAVKAAAAGVDVVSRRLLSNSNSTTRSGLRRGPRSRTRWRRCRRAAKAAVIAVARCGAFANRSFKPSSRRFRRSNANCWSKCVPAVARAKRCAIKRWFGYCATTSPRRCWWKQASPTMVMHCCIPA